MSTISNPFLKGVNQKNKKDSSLLDLPMEEFFHIVEAHLSFAIENLEQKLDLDSYPLFLGQAMYVLSLPNEAIISYQRGVKELLGYDENEFNAELTANCFHPNQAQLLQKIIKGAINYGITQTLEEEKDAWLLLIYKCRKKDGSYVPVLRQTSLFERDKNGRMMSSVSILTDLSGMNNADSVEWRFKGSMVNEQKFHSYIYGAMLSLFSKRELEILNLMAQGQTSKRIGESLFISKNTVDTHRRNMLKKADCANTNELIQFSKTNGIL